MNARSKRSSASASCLVSAISRLLHDSNTADFTLTCGEKEWKLHSNILAIRSPFFEAAVATNMAEKLDMEMEVKELDPEAMQQVINFMYGKPIEEAPFGSLLEASERFQMSDMKEEVIKIGSEKISKENVLEIGKLAEFYDIEQLLRESAEFIVKNDIEMKEDDMVPKLTTRVLKKLKEALKRSNLKEKESSDNLKRIEQKVKECSDAHEGVTAGRRCPGGLCGKRKNPWDDYSFEKIHF